MPANCGVTVLCALVVCFEAVSGCASGFMRLNLLQKRAEKISNGNTVSGNKLDHELRVVPELKFTCSGNITSLLLGGDVRTSVDNRVEYPEVQIWRRRLLFGLVIYTKEYSQTIELSSGNFSSDGLLRYNLTTPISFENEDVLGVYHPLQNDSIVRLFYVNDPNAPVSEFINSSNVNEIAPGQTLSGHHILIYPVTDPPGCTNGNFLAPEALRQKTLEVNINRVVVRDRQQRVFPDISFTCDGSITKWIVGARTGSSSSLSSELQIWRRSGANSYTKVTSTQLTAQSPINNSNVYEYVPSAPLGFQEGDILGVYQREDSSVVPYYQESTGPVNLRQSGEHNIALNSLTATQVTEYDYPLVTVEIGPPLTNAPHTTEGSLMSTDVVIDRTKSTYFMQLQSEYFTTVFTAASTSASPTVTQQAEDSIMIVVIAAPVVLVVIIVIIIMIVTLIIIFTWRRRSHKNTHSVKYPAVSTSGEIVELQQNECYMTTKGDTARQRMDLHIHGHISRPAEHTKEENINSKLPNTDIYSSIPDEDEYAVIPPMVSSAPDVFRTSTTDGPMSLQQNVSYISMAPNKPDESDGQNGSNEYIYDEVGPQHKPCATNPAEPAMVEPGNITDGRPIADEDYI